MLSVRVFFVVVDVVAVDVRGADKDSLVRVRDGGCCSGRRRGFADTSVCCKNQGLDLEVVDVVLVKDVNISDAFVTRES